MKHFKFFIISILLFACSPRVLPKVSVPSSTPIKITVTSNSDASKGSYTPLPTKTITPTPLKSIELNFELPPDCSIFDSFINSEYYADLSHGACNNPSLSPNKSKIAYASLVITETGEIVQEVRLFSIALGKSLPVYRSKCGVLYPEWTSTDDLVISDYSQDVGCGYTIIYDIEKAEVIATFDGVAHRSWQNRWSNDKNAFFTLSPELFGPACSEMISGFDFNSNQPMPHIKPITSNTNLYVVIGEPTWSKDGKVLSAVIRDGICSNLASYECIYSNSYIISIDFSQITPTVTYPFYSPETDFSFVVSNDGLMEVKSTPIKATNCWDVDRQ